MQYFGGVTSKCK